MSKFKKLLSIFLVFTMVFSLFPVSAFAETGELNEEEGTVLSLTEETPAPTEAPAPTETPAPTAPAHDCEGELEQIELDEGELGWRCPVCGVLFDAEGNELIPAKLTSGTGVTSGSFNGSPAEVDAEGNLMINAANFPDENFRSYITSTFDTSNQGYLTVADRCCRRCPAFCAGSPG